MDGKFATSERVEKYIEDNNKENARRDVIIDALANGRRRTIDYVDGETDLFYATEKDDIFIDKIEGETLVNVCDQEEPIAITKSYTVENTNHVALQGEYDGKCRPVVYGNTLVNRNVEHNKSMVIGNAINESGTEINIIGTANSEVEVSLDGHTALNLGTKKGGELCKSFESTSGNEIKLTTDGNSKTDVVCQGDTLVNLCNNNSTGSNIGIRTYYFSQNLKGRKVTIQINTGDLDTTYMEWAIYRRKDGANTGSFITYINDFSIKVVDFSTDAVTDFDKYVLFIRNYNGSEYIDFDYTKIKVNVFEGDLTQTPELIPTEYVKGIQSTFEDKYIPYSIYNGDNLTSITETQYQLPLTVKTNTTYTVVTTMNTTKYQYAIYSQDSLSEYLAYENTLSTAIFSSDKANISFKVRMNPSYEGEDYNFVLDEVKDKFLIVEGNFSGRENLLTSEYFGKYKVDMQSVGKNLFDIDYVINKRTDRVEKYNNGIKIQHCLINLTDFIKNKSKIYTLSWDAEILYKIDGKAGIGFSFVYTDGSEEYFISLKSGHNTISSNKNKTIQRFVLTFSTACTAIFTNIQLEEGTVVTEYEPYCGTTKTVYLNSPLYEGDELLTKDGKIYHYHKMGSVVLDGSEDTWTNSSYLSDNVIRFYTTMSRGISKKNTVLYCDRFRYDGVYENYQSYESELIHHDQDFNFVIYKSKLPTTDLNGFKQWLSENPTTVVYELAEPWYEEIGAYGKLILDGSEDEGWIANNTQSSTNYYSAYTLNYKTNNVNVVCDKFKTESSTSITNFEQEYIRVSTNNKGIYINLNSSKMSGKNLGAFKQWLQQNPITVIYELINPQLIDEDMIFDIATSSTLSYESAVPMGTTSFLPYTNELPLLETSTQYRVSFDCDVVGLPLVISLGGTTTTITSELHNTLSIITPSIETNGKLTIDGSGMVNIDNVVVTKGEMVYEYFEGLKSSFEEDIIDLLKDAQYEQGTCVVAFDTTYENLKTNTTNSYHAKRGRLIEVLPIKKNTNYTYIVEEGYYASISLWNEQKHLISDKSFVTSPYTFNSENASYFVIVYRKKDDSNFDATIIQPKLQLIENNKYKVKITLTTNDDNLIFGKGGRL